MGLGCDPFDEIAAHRVPAIKQRPAEKGMILIAGDLAQLDDIVDWTGLPAERTTAVRATWPGAHTWVPPPPQVPRWITGAYTAAGASQRVCGCSRVLRGIRRARWCRPAPTSAGCLRCVCGTRWTKRCWRASTAC